MEISPELPAPKNRPASPLRRPGPRRKKPLIFAPFPYKIYALHVIRLNIGSGLPHSLLVQVSCLGFHATWASEFPILGFGKLGARTSGFTNWGYSNTRPRTISKILHPRTSIRGSATGCPFEPAAGRPDRNLALGASPMGQALALIPKVRALKALLACLLEADQATLDHTGLK